MTSSSNPAWLLARNSLLRCNSVSEYRVTGEGLLAIVEISEEGVYVVRMVVVVVVVAVVVVAGVLVTAEVVAAVVVAAVVVDTAGVELRLPAAVVVVKNASKSMVSLGSAAMLLIDVNSMLVISYDGDGDIVLSRQCAEGDDRYRWWLSILRNVEGRRGSLYPWRGALCQILVFSSRYVVSDFPSMLFSYLFTTSLPLSLCFSAGNQWFGISCSWFMFSVVNFLPTFAIAVGSLNWSLLEGCGRIVGIFGVT